MGKKEHLQLRYPMHTGRFLGGRSAPGVTSSRKGSWSTRAARYAVNASRKRPSWIAAGSGNRGNYGRPRFRSGDACEKSGRGSHKLAEKYSAHRTASLYSRSDITTLTVISQE